MKFLQYEKDGRIGMVHFHRPEALNALNRGLLTELEHFLTTTLPEEDLQVLILTGSGEKSFIAGADIKEMNDLTPEEMHNFLAIGQRVALLLERVPVVTIAAVNGFALGGGMEMALACDFIYASEKAKLGLPEVTLGLIPGFGGTQRLSRAVGTRMAKELLFTGRMLTATEALQLGIVNQVSEPAELLNACRETAARIASNGFFAIREAKRVVNSGSEAPLETGLELERHGCTVCFATEDRQEGMTAFIEKRKPAFRNA